MKLVEIQWSPSSSQLRQFGVLSCLVLPFLGWLWSVSVSGIALLLVTGVAIALLSFFWLPAVKYLFVGLTIAVAPIGMVLGEVAMLLIFLGVFLPISLIFRLIGRDSLQRKMDKNVSTYWQTKQESDKVSNYYRRY